MTNSIVEHIKSSLPETVFLGQLVLRRAALWQQAGVIFIHVPKNGGTSINQSLYGRFMGHYRVRDIERFRPSLLSSLPSMAVARNPWARAYSAWNFARLGAAMTDGAQIRNPGKYQIREFETFERFVLEWLPSRSLDQEDYVFRPQSHFVLTCKRDIGVSHFGRIEDSASYLPFLQEILGRKIEVGHLNRTVDFLHYRKAYTPEMRDTLASCYAVDFESLDYDF